MEKREKEWGCQGRAPDAGRVSRVGRKAAGGTGVQEGAVLGQPGWTSEADTASAPQWHRDYTDAGLALGPSRGDLILWESPRGTVGGVGATLSVWSHDVGLGGH